MSWKYNVFTSTFDYYEAPATVGSGESNTASNLGTGEGLATTKSALDLPFKSIDFASTKISVTSNVSTVLIDVNEANIVHQNLSGAGTNTHSDIDTHVGEATIHFIEGSIDHTAIANIGTNSHGAIDTHIGDAGKHREINDSGTASTDLWSADKIGTEITSSLPFLNPRVIFKEQFTGTGIETQFQLDGTTLNGTFTTGTWAATDIRTTLPHDITKTNYKAIYDSANIFTRNRVSVSSISTGGLITLSHAPLAENFYIYYWYEVQDGQVIDDYYREDYLASMESVNAMLAISVDVNTANFNNILSGSDNDLQTALETLDDHDHPASDITDFDTEVSNNIDVAANTAARHIGSGEVYINNIIPNGGGNVGTKVYTANSNDSVLESCVADDLDLRVYVISLIGPSNLRPAITVNGIAVGNWDYDAYDTDNRVLFKGYADITLVGTTVTATHEDGAISTCTVVADSKPVISICNFINGYPGSQTELKAGDSYDVRVTADLAFVEIEIENSGACDYQSSVVGSTTDSTVTTTIADRGTSSVARPARVRVKKSTGTWSEWVYTNAGAGAVDGTDLVFCNNLYPTVDSMNQSSITYPATQEAIKSSETVDVHCTCSDYDTISYTSPNGDLSIPSSTAYLEDKTGVARIAGNYNITTTNYNVSCNRAANDATTAETLVVYIAHVAATVTATEASRLRTGGNNSTSIQNHTITLTASQSLRIAPTVAAPSANGGIWSGVFAGGPTVWTRTLQCHDTNDTPGAYTYQALSAYNLANIETTSYTGDSNYTIGGFVSRTIALAAFANEATFLAKVADYTKCTLTWSVKSLPNQRAFNTTSAPDANSWCLAGTLGISPTTIRVLDTAASSSSSNETSLIVEESI